MIGIKANLQPDVLWMDMLITQNVDGYISDMISLYFVSNDPDEDARSSMEKYITSHIVSYRVPRLIYQP